MALITGGGAGLGFSSARILLERRAKVVIAELNPALEDQVTKDLSPISKEFCFIACDVAKKEDIEKAVEFTVKEFGSIHILINNGQGYLPNDFLLKVPDEAFELAFLTGPLASH